LRHAQARVHNVRSKQIGGNQTMQSHWILYGLSYTSSVSRPKRRNHPALCGCEMQAGEDPNLNVDVIATCAIIRFMNSRHRRTLEVVFSEQVPPSLEWSRIEALLVAAGAQVIEGRGSRVRFELNGIVATFHRPHPAKEAKPYQVRDARAFLKAAGVRP